MWKPFCVTALYEVMMKNDNVKSQLGMYESEYFTSSTKAQATQRKSVFGINGSKRIRNNDSSSNSSNNSFRNGNIHLAANNNLADLTEENFTQLIPQLAIISPSSSNKVQSAAPSSSSFRRAGTTDGGNSFRRSGGGTGGEDNSFRTTVARTTINNNTSLNSNIVISNNVGL